MIRIKPQFDMKAVNRAIEEYAERIRQHGIETLSDAGYRFVTLAWQNADFMNHTYDLRSSIGYMVIEDGEILKEQFKAQGGSKNGVATGRQVAIDNAPKEGLSLIVVAGMFYAIYVQAKNRDVLDGSMPPVIALLEKALQG